MKTMTCKQLGGPCDLAHQGDSADEIIKAQDAHLKASGASGDETHADALSAMKGRWKHPVSGMRWYKTMKSDFAALTEDVAP
jgi:predicted small metal-binding protein